MRENKQHALYWLMVFITATLIGLCGCKTIPIGPFTAELTGMAGAAKRQVVETDVPILVR